MEAKEINLDENYDWQATRAIFFNDVVGEKTNGEATLHIPLNCQQLLAFRILSPSSKQLNTGHGASTSATGSRSSSRHDDDDYWINPRFQYLVMGELDDPPIVQVTFQYTSSDCEAYPHSVDIEILQYPRLWPMGEKELWTGWMNSRANDLLREELFSFPICTFVAHDAFEYFEIMDHNNQHGYTSILLQETSFGYYDHPWKSSHDHDVIRVIDDIRVHNKDVPFNTPKIHRYARHAMKRHWKRYTQYECPICYCTELCSKDTVELPCDHFFCRDCMDMYVKTIVEGINSCRVNPFVCPIPSCKANMNVMGNVPKGIRMCDFLLSQEQMDKVLCWKKDIDFPPSHVLSICPRVACRKDGMRKLNNYATNTIVRCEECSACFCELCLKRIYKKQLGFDHRQECDETQVLKLVKRYLRATPDIQQRCHEKWHWIKSYASSRNVDQSVSLWVQEHANVCPNCRNGIERSEGCFHMNCTQCGTHFCYECGEEIFYPYYGTHHCWEEEDNDDEFQFNLFGDFMN
jgi:IBR domain.